MTNLGIGNSSNNSQKIKILNFHQKTKQVNLDVPVSQVRHCLVCTESGLVPAAVLNL